MKKYFLKKKLQLDKYTHKSENSQSHPHQWRGDAAEMLIFKHRQKLDRRWDFQMDRSRSLLRVRSSERYQNHREKRYFQFVSVVSSWRTFLVAILSKNVLTFSQKQNFHRFMIYENEGGCVEKCGNFVFSSSWCPSRAALPKIHYFSSSWQVLESNGAIMSELASSQSKKQTFPLLLAGGAPQRGYEAGVLRRAQWPFGNKQH